MGLILFDYPNFLTSEVDGFEPKTVTKFENEMTPPFRGAGGY
jgi:hypothetical protein